MTQLEEVQSTADVSEISRRRFTMAGLSAGAALLTPATLLAKGNDPHFRETVPPRLPRIPPWTNTSVASLKQIDAGLLNVGYAESGPANGRPVILLQGWPYDIY